MWAQLGMPTTKVTAICSECVYGETGGDIGVLYPFEFNWQLLPKERIQQKRHVLGKSHIFYNFSAQCVCVCYGRVKNITHMAAPGPYSTTPRLPPGKLLPLSGPFFSSDDNSIYSPKIWLQMSTLFSGFRSLCVVYFPPCCPEIEG